MPSLASPLWGKPDYLTSILLFQFLTPVPKNMMLFHLSWSSWSPIPTFFPRWLTSLNHSDLAPIEEPICQQNKVMLTEKRPFVIYSSSPSEDFAMAPEYSFSLYITFLRFSSLNTTGNVTHRRRYRRTSWVPSLLRSLKPCNRSNILPAPTPQQRFTDVSRPHEYLNGTISWSMPQTSSSSPSNTT